jgi:PD-(D/E)XK nuclease superfamily
MLDSSAIKCWLDCREQFRLRYIENRVAAEPSFHQAYGIAIHLAAETHNLGGSYEEGLRRAADSLQTFPEHLLNPYKQQRFRELAAELPSIVACYFDGVEVGSVVAVEQEWSYEYSPKVTLCGRKDKVERDPEVLFDLKTASEIGKTWKADFRNSMLRDFGLALYDWHECQIGRLPKTVKVECLVKPYKGTEPRLEIFDLPEITVYRERFKNQLAWVVAEITHYYHSYLAMQPWPMASGQCLTKYGPCEYLPGCLQGWTSKTLANYTQREEHLHIRREQSNGISIQQTNTGESN